MKLLDKIKSELPKRKKQCNCEKSEFGYHIKECTFYEYGWNDYRSRVLAIIKKLGA